MFSHTTRRWLMALVLLPVVWAASGQQAQPLSLTDCLKQTVANSATLQKARLEARRGDLQVKELTAQGLPQISASAQINYNPTLQVIFFPDFLNGNPDEVSPVTIGTSWGAQGNISLEQLAYSPSYNVARRAARASSEFYQLMVDKTAEDLLLDVAKVYYSAQMVQKQRGLIEANLAQVEALLRLSRLQLENGFGRQVEVDQLTVNRINLENQLRNLDVAYEQQLNSLKFAMQMPLETGIVLTDTLSENYALPQLAAVKPSFTSRMDFAVLEKTRQLHTLNQLRYKAEYLPSVSLFANINALAQPAEFSGFTKSRSWADYSSIGLRLQIPIFDGFRRRSLVDQVEIDLLQNAEDVRNANSAFQLRYQNARLSLQSNLNNLEPLKENRRMAEVVYQQAQQRYREGIAPITEVVNAETAMREAQTNFLLALFQVKLAELELLDVNGELRRMIQ